jgi:hypothetical protein
VLPARRSDRRVDAGLGQWLDLIGVQGCDRPSELTRRPPPCVGLRSWFACFGAARARSPIWVLLEGHPPIRLSRQDFLYEDRLGQERAPLPDQELPTCKSQALRIISHVPVRRHRRPGES